MQYKKQYIMTFNIFMIFILITLALSCLISLGNILLAEKEPQKEKITSYECGFNPFEDARNKFDVRFYVVAILFIIFDLEVIFLCPWSLVLRRIDSLGF